MKENKPQEQTWRIIYLEGSSESKQFKQIDFIKCLTDVSEDIVILADKERISESEISAFRHQYVNRVLSDSTIAYLASCKRKLHMGIFSNQWCADREIINSPLLIGRREVFLKAYGGDDLGQHPLESVGYSLQKVGGVRF